MAPPRDLLLVLLSSVALSCASKPTCAAGDLACLFASITVRDLDSSANTGPKLALFPVNTGPVSALIARSSGPDGGNADGGFFVIGPSSMTYDNSSATAVIALIWSDPFGCRPALCMTPCPKGVQCLGLSSCTGTVRDGLNRGFSSHVVEYDKQPAQALDFELDITPVSAPGCPTDVTALLTAFAADVLVGTPTPIQVHIPGSKDGSGGDGGTGDWYYHWNCHGDSECLSTNSTGAASGTSDEGPVQANCTQLLQFAQKFWGSAAADACDQSPTWSG